MDASSRAVIIITITLAATLCQPKSLCVIASDVNLALGKPTSQSGTTHLGEAGKAVDGNKAAYFYNNSCSHTDYQPITWWQVDLLTFYVITGLEITNRQVEESSRRLVNITVEVTSLNASKLPEFPGLTSSPVCQRRVEKVPASANLYLECTRPILGRYVRIIKYSDSSNIQDYPLSLCEVEVYGRSQWRLVKQVRADGTAEILETVVGIPSRLQCARECVQRYPCRYIQIDRVEGVCRLLTSFQASSGYDPTVEWDLYTIDMPRRW